MGSFMESFGLLKKLTPPALDIVILFFVYAVAVYYNLKGPAAQTLSYEQACLVSLFHGVVIVAVIWTLVLAAVAERRCGAGGDAESRVDGRGIIRVLVWPVR